MDLRQAYVGWGKKTPIELMGNHGKWPKEVKISFKVLELIMVSHLSRIWKHLAGSKRTS